MENELKIKYSFSASGCVRQERDIRGKFTRTILSVQPEDDFMILQEPPFILSRSDVGKKSVEFKDNFVVLANGEIAEYSCEDIESRKPHVAKKGDPNKSQMDTFERALDVDMKSLIRYLHDRKALSVQGIGRAFGVPATTAENWIEKSNVVRKTWRNINGIK